MKIHLYSFSQKEADEYTNLLLLEDSILVVYEPKMKDGFLSAFNINTSHLISTFASIGESPEEFINPRIINWEGNVLKKITFDKSVSSFCIDDDTIPYVIAMGDDGELHVYECSIS